MTSDKHLISKACGTRGSSVWAFFSPNCCSSSNQWHGPPLFPSGVRVVRRRCAMEDTYPRDRYWRTGVHLLMNACWRSPGSRACCFLSVRGFYRLRRTGQPLACNAAAVLPSSSRNRVGILIFRLFEAQSPGPPMPLSTLRMTPHDGTRKTRGQDGFATSFPAGDSHPIQHAGLARRTPSRR